MKLDNWRAISGICDASPGPEQGLLRLRGTVTGHPRCEDGREVTTSLVLSRQGECIVTQSGSHYDLGKPNSDYESQFPNARERLLVALPSQDIVHVPARSGHDGGELGTLRH